MGLIHNITEKNMSQHYNAILVSNYTLGIGLPYYYYLAFCDVLGKENVHFVGEESRNYSTALVQRVKRKVLEKSGKTAQAKLNKIKQALDTQRLNLVILFNTSNLGLPQIKEIRNWKNIRLLHYISDHPLGMFNPRKDITRESAPLFDQIAAFGHNHVPMFYQWGCKQVIRLPFAYCKYTHLYPTKDLEIKHSGQLYYFGTWTPEVEKWLEHLTGFDLYIEGTHWQFAKNNRLRELGSKKNPSMENNMAIAARKAGMVVNFTRAQHACLHSMKTFELAIAGACVLSNRSHEQLEFFEEDKEYIFFNTPEEMKEKITYLHSHPNKVLKIKELAIQKAMPHSYHARVNQWLKEIK
ncbi:MAG: glycosyltransferase [Bacteroidales bacterium]|nr:glycosyltransferase [Bacteroidales bacterium]